MPSYRVTGLSPDGNPLRTNSRELGERIVGDSATAAVRRPDDGEIHEAYDAASANETYNELAGAKGFDPPDGGIKARYFATWAAP